MSVVRSLLPHGILHQLVVEGLIGHELAVSACLCHLPMAHHADLVCVLDGGQAVSDDHTCTALAGSV